MGTKLQVGRLILSFIIFQSDPWLEDVTKGDNNNRHPGFLSLGMMDRDSLTTYRIPQLH